MKRKGSITIYLAIVLLSVLLLICVVIEGARVAAVQSKAKSITYMASDSVLAGYARQVYEDYGLLLVWGKEDMRNTLESYIQANIQMADLEVKGTDLLNADVRDVEVKRKVYITDKGGQEFRNQITKYLGYAGLTESVIDLINNSKNIKEEKDTNNVAHDVKPDNKCEEIISLSDEIDSKIKILKKTKEQDALIKDIKKDFQALQKKPGSSLLRKVIKQINQLEKELLMKEDNIDEVIAMLNKYIEKKKVLLKENNIKYSDDYMDENLESLKKVKDKIGEIKELSFSKAERIDSNTISKIETKIQNLSFAVEVLSDLIINSSTEKDKENNSIYENVKEILNTGVLSLVVDNISEISTNAIDTSNVPSMIKKEETSKKTSQIEKAKIAIYSNIKFGNYLDVKKETALSYEMEYIVAGKESDKANLATVVERLVAIRNATNLICLLKDADKMAEIDTIAASVALVTELPFMEKIAKAVLIESWALAESINDVKALLRGKKISLIKNKENWKTDLKSLFESTPQGEKEGFSYSQYLDVLILFTKKSNATYRTMDLIQLNVCKKYNNDFRMCDSIVGFSANVIFDIPPMFTSMPWTMSMIEGKGGYKYNIGCTNNY